MSRSRRVLGKTSHPKAQFRPRCERLEAREMMVGDLQLELNNLFPIDETNDGWDEGEDLSISLVEVSEWAESPAEEGTIWSWEPRTAGISDVAWLYTFSGLLSSATLEFVVGAQVPLADAEPSDALGLDPNVIIPWSLFAGAGFDGTDLITVTLTALTSAEVEGETVLVPILVDPLEDDNWIPFAAETFVGLNNLAPTITNIDHTSEGGGGCAGGPTSVTLTAILGDPSVNDTVTATVNWGDSGYGPEDEFAFNGSGSHVYTTAGNYIVTITAMDDDGETTVETHTVSVTGGGGGTGDVSLAGGVLTITGSCGDDLVYVSTDGGTLSVQANFLPAPEIFAASAVTEIRALLGDGDDAFTVAGNIDLPMVVVGGNGNDILMGGRGASLLIGGDGSDMLFGGRGQDALIGGSTVHDTNAAALGELLAEWLANLNTPLAFAEDVELAIVDDGDSDVLHGGQDVDLLFLDGALDDALAARRDIVVNL